ncbi:GNAT family N-acetyltransferase [Amycolatopsis viridis]|uniref:RimJ/RimL family protein N-acetyltransferase/catechol 2,3-dioxygenase-like lactoylglutathione lyase family enzyme n=1 Tax=Amycolatopsis viridis TaxID=185678 RepID=A0ABX0SWM8_9PSEU|nr:GNAT family N-acetyltransferase [Amycolatopsis viridis]NIH79945.1 RimJ/RimL family protein N-acetyltransferase/catechol 2,3-dioxygenase-like lactoylglutathione lyase family enzyme [Amycolatopsis viridis]
MTVPDLRTPRLRLRGLHAGDTEAIVRIFADPEMSRFLATDLSDPARCRASVARRLSYAGPDGTGHWVVEREGEVIGLAHLRPSTELSGDLVEIGYFLDPAHGGQGLATEAADALLRHAFAALGLPAVWALVHESNVASRNLVHRLGFTDVGGGEHYGGPHRVFVALPAAAGQWHHVELWVPDLARAEESFGWLLTELGWREHQRWRDGVSWKLGAGYLVVEQSPALTGAVHDRCAPGLNHVALHAGSPERVGELAQAALAHGWRPLFAERYPHAGGADHYAAYLENADGFEVELVADWPRFTRPG